MKTIIYSLITNILGLCVLLFLGAVGWIIYIIIKETKENGENGLLDNEEEK